MTLNSHKIKDSTFSVNVLSRLNGKIALRVNGAGKPKSRFSKFNEPGYLCEGIVYLSKESSSIILTNADIIEEFNMLRSCMEGLNCISYITNFISGLFPEKMKIEGFLENTTDFFYLKECVKIEKINMFRFFTLHKLGYIPDFSVCGNCGGRIKKSAYFNINENNVYCEICRTGYSNNYFVFEADFLIYYKKLISYLVQKNILDFFQSNNNIYQKNLEKFIDLFIISLNKNDIKSYGLLKSIDSELQVE
ncbi:DNA repair protein RecO [Candidatus Dependentiae bacterium]|nr:DNA repair protein RecO [Candidatus Dependentiae bacterium]